MGCWFYILFMGIWNIVGIPFYWLLEKFDDYWLPDRIYEEDKFQWIIDLKEWVPLIFESIFALIGMYLWGSLVIQIGRRELDGKFVDFSWLHWLILFCVCMSPSIVGDKVDPHRNYKLASIAYLPSFFILAYIPAIPKFLTSWVPWLR
jgi:hypothetical protein